MCDPVRNHVKGNPTPHPTTPHQGAATATRAGHTINTMAP